MGGEGNFQGENEVQDPERELFADNLPPNCNQYKFEQLFAPYGAKEKCIFRQHQTGTRTGYGFVILKTAFSASQALKDLNGTNMDGHNIRIMHCKKTADLVSDKNLYVCDLPDGCSKGQLENIFSEFGDIAECRILIDNTTQQTRGVGFVHYKDSDSAKSALNSLNGTIPSQGTKPLMIRFARESKRGRFRGRGGRGGYGPMRFGGRDMMNGFAGGCDQSFGVPNSMFAGGFAGPQRGGFAFNRGRGGRSIFPDENKLRNLFSDFGSIEKCTITTQSDAQENRGVGFIHFVDQNAAAAAIESLDGTTPNEADIAISVKYANRGGNMANASYDPMQSYNPMKGFSRGGGSGIPCRFFKEGKCTKGLGCQFAHANNPASGGFPAPYAVGGRPMPMNYDYGGGYDGYGPNQYGGYPSGGYDYQGGY